MLWKPGAHLPPWQVKEDADRIFNTGYFHFVDWKAEDTRDGIKLTLEVGGPESQQPLLGVAGSSFELESVCTAA